MLTNSTRSTSLGALHGSSMRIMRQMQKMIKSIKTVVKYLNNKKSKFYYNNKVSERDSPTCELIALDLNHWRPCTEVYKIQDITSNLGSILTSYNKYQIFLYFG